MEWPACPQRQNSFELYMIFFICNQMCSALPISPSLFKERTCTRTLMEVLLSKRNDFVCPFSRYTFRTFGMNRRELSFTGFWKGEMSGFKRQKESIQKKLFHNTFCYSLISLSFTGIYYVISDNHLAVFIWVKQSFVCLCLSVCVCAVELTGTWPFIMTSSAKRTLTGLDLSIAFLAALMNADLGD